MVEETVLQLLAKRLIDADDGRQPIAPLSDEIKMSMHEAYAIQRLVSKERMGRGDEVVGHKIGLTSKAMQSMFNVMEPDFGPLWRSWQKPNGSTVSLIDFIAPRLEVEVALVLKYPLSGASVTAMDVALATEYLVGAYEIVDSRITDWKITIFDTVADGASGGCFVLGDLKRSPLDLEAGKISMSLKKNGEIVSTGAARAVQGHPFESVAWLARALGRFGEEMIPGEVVLSGAMAAAVPLEGGCSYEADLLGLGTLKLEVVA
ncbi:2-oxopent-4-enoate/cis-2-oxohex-4-enoate hydratase [Ferrithrix thermotolerans DSM 19514]|uniref:2-oxopent-4-enoate/cis-2-oxohex-4-enoate hydratase n=1 Tax=Ferrithrix thermotolerans DSM 19514 TaxID=1121881 RepID=A0A1M4V238_9ACTN|nr:fumarylacetoacetate hydrolase family protein [Ferrithrix thermotolerans]SHE63054.1 2-oxopent-4-enoate/cis-2-oxohex-4-enoate hydratase [Ferrithrix thermotolerans DSM 19514]